VAGGRCNDRGRLVDLAIMIADGGEVIADIDADHDGRSWICAIASARDVEVIGGGVRPDVTRPQPDSEQFTGVVAGDRDRMEVMRTLVVSAAPSLSLWAITRVESTSSAPFRRRCPGPAARAAGGPPNSRHIHARTGSPGRPRPRRADRTPM
jgi:hypothetical protein